TARHERECDREKGHNPAMLCAHIDPIVSQAPSHTGFPRENSMRRLLALAATAAPTAAEILAANKQATVTAGWDSKATLKTSYDYSGQGMTGKTHSLTDITTGHYADDFVIGPMNGANGFDGKDGWAKDPSGAVTVQAGGDQRKLAVNEAYRRSNAWWQPD